MAALPNARTGPHRLEVIELDQGVTIVDDCYNASPSSMEAALATLRSGAEGRRLGAILGDMLELGPKELDLHRQVGRACGGLGWLLCFGARSVAIAEGARAAGVGEVGLAQDLDGGMEFVREHLQRGDAVLLKASRRHEAGTVRVSPWGRQREAGTRCSSPPPRPARCIATEIFATSSATQSFRMVIAGLICAPHRKSMCGALLGPWVHPEPGRAPVRPKSNVREDTPESHQKKKGTPTISGGGLILFSMTVATLLCADLGNRGVCFALTVTLGYAAIGFTDDYLKLSKKNSKGFAGKKKLFWQTFIFVAAFALFETDLKFHLTSVFPFLSVGSHLSSRIYFPFDRHLSPDLKWLYPFFAFFVIVGTSNAVNLTDGLDGLAIGPSIVSAITFGVLAWVAGTLIAGFNIASATFYLPHTSTEAEELSVFCAAMAGAGIAFLWYNAYPATVFMGDVGSLALGGALGSLAVLTKQNPADLRHRQWAVLVEILDGDDPGHLLQAHRPPRKPGWPSSTTTLDAPGHAGAEDHRAGLDRRHPPRAHLAGHAQAAVMIRPSHLVAEGDAGRRGRRGQVGLGRRALAGRWAARR